MVKSYYQYTSTIFQLSVSHSAMLDTDMFYELGHMFPHLRMDNMLFHDIYRQDSEHMNHLQPALYLPPDLVSSQNSGLKSKETL